MQLEIQNRSYLKNVALDFVLLAWFWSYNQWQKPKTAIWTILCFSPLPPLNNVEEQWGTILNTLFKIPIIFCHWLSEIYKKRRKRFDACCCKWIKCFFESHYVTLHPTWALWQKTVPKWRISCHNIRFKLLSSGSCQKYYFKYTMRDVVVWLSCYVYIFAILTYLTSGNQCLTMFFFQKLCVIGKISIRWSKKKH